jgi:diacylglycerol kinase family enzyme
VTENPGDPAIDTRLRVRGLINRTAGTAARHGGETLRDTLSGAFAERGVVAEVELLAGEALRAGAERALAEAKDGTIDAVVVGGGDGSIRTVAAVLTDTDIPLGILPLGTLNHFAKDLGIPNELDGAIAIISEGLKRRVDVAEVNGQVFINNSSIGIYPYVVLDRERRRRRAGQSKWTAMALAAWRAFRHLPVRRLAIDAESLTQPCRTPCLFVGNNAYEVHPPLLARRARLDQGQLCLYVAKSQTRAALLWLAVRTALGLHDHARDLQTIHTRTAEIRSRASRLLVAADGEVEVLRPPLRYRVKPGALTVFAPPSQQTSG